MSVDEKPSFKPGLGASQRSDAGGPAFETRVLSEEHDVLGMEIQAWGLIAVVDAADEEVGKERVDALFESWGIDARALMRDRAWLKFDFAERFMDGMASLAGPEVIERAGRAAMSRRYLGPIYPLVRAFGSVGSTFDRLVKSGPRYNKARHIRVEHTSPRSARIMFSPREGFGMPKTRHFCNFARAQTESIPMLFGRRPALVREECICDGHEHCTFFVEWDASGVRIRPWMAFVLAFASVGALAVGLNASLLVSFLFAALGATCAYLLLENRHQSKDIEELVSGASVYRTGLLSSARQNEERFEALVDAKAHVDEQVEVRTGELTATTVRLHKTLTELRSLNRARDDFFSNISHELRTPLTLLLSPIEQLARGEEPAGGHKVAVVAMERNARRLITMIDQLLDVARSESENATLHRSAVDPAAFVQALRESFGAAATAKSVSLSFDASRAPSVVGVDAAWLETALTNLLANGLRYSSAGDTLSLCVIDKGDELLFEVSDEGPGIAEELRPRLFERFSRGVGAMAGTGIGLALVAEAVRLHEGRVEVDSEVGLGATFRLYIPRVLVKRESLQSIAPMLEQNAEATIEETREGPDEAAPLALVVDDNADVRRFVCDVLAVRYRVESATNGERALIKAKELVPDVIVSDVSMPKMDGLELTRAIRNSKVLREVPVVLVTARSETDRVLAGFDAGAEDYVAKPFHGRELLARVDALVHARRLAGRVAHRERLATLGFTASSVAHNIRNPLNSLIAGLPAVEHRLGDAMDAPTKRMFAIFRECANRIEAVTRDLLDLSRADGEDALGNYSPGRGLSACVRLMESRFPDSVAFELDVDESAQVRGRAGDMNTAFLNLLDNAARAVDRSGAMRITGKVHQGEYLVCVEDTGPGVPESLGRRIFEPFVTTRASGEGVGLGLAIAQEVATQHDGTIRVDESSLGGAAFRIRIPLAR